MSWLRRLLGNEHSADKAERHAASAIDAGIADSGSDIVEVDVVGEASYQGALERLAGRKGPEGKSYRVGVTLRCEPGNQYDANAIRVEAMGQLVGYIPRTTASQLAPVLASHGGAAEAQGLIVGGWKNGEDEGHFGIRVWFTRRDAERLGVLAVLVMSPVPSMPPPGAGEVRLSPLEGEIESSHPVSVAVTCEEHYQPAIEASKPTADWNRDWWPALASLALVDCNPHAKKPAPCIAVSLNGAIVGYLTPAMTQRHAPTIQAITEAGQSATANAHIARGTKGGHELWRLHLVMTRPADDPDAER